MVSTAAILETPQVIDEQSFHAPLRSEKDQAHVRSVLILGFLLAFLQLADGLLTSIGVSRYGTEAEGNPLLRFLMEQFGYIPTLTIVKLFAVLVVVMLTTLALRMPWVRSAMTFVSAVYIIAAVIPWTYILFVKPLI